MKRKSTHYSSWDKICYENFGLTTEMEHLISGKYYLITLQILGSQFFSYKLICIFKNRILFQPKY